MAHKVLLTFFISMLPVVELRGGLPYGIALGLDYPLALIAAVLGNMVPVPFIILYIYDLIDYYLREWVRREQKMRVCKNCGKYFAITGRTNAEYCDRVFDSKGRTCKDVGAIAKWTREKDTDDVFKAYRREYKKRFAWTKSGKILPEELYAWGERAREKKTECDSGKITLEEYTTWLKES